MKSIYTWNDFKIFMKYPHLIGHMAGMKDLTELHSKWIHDVHDSKKDFSMMASRSSYKSSSIDTIGSIYHMIRYPEETCAITRKTYTAAAEVIKAVADITDMPAIHELMRFAFFADEDGNVPSGCDWKFRTRKEGKLNLSVRESVTPECSLEALGLDSKVTGRHYDFCICDDIVDINDRLYQATREYTKMMMGEIRSNVVKKTGHTAVIGTKWARDDAFDVLEREGVLTADNIYPWQRLPFIPASAIEDARRKQTPALFACNYELRYDSGSDCLFKDPRIGDWDFKHVKNVICHVDASYGGEDGNGITLIGSLPGDKLCVVGFKRPGHVKDHLDFICRMMQKYGAKTLYLEDNSDKGYTGDSILSNPIAKKYGIWIESYHETMQKQNKISSVLYDNWANIVFSRETDADYLCEITDWNEKTKNHDDCPDSLASALLRGNFSINDWRSLWK